VIRAGRAVRSYGRTAARAALLGAGLGLTLASGAAAQGRGVQLVPDDSGRVLTVVCDEE
jgi:hypothetical protein